MIFLKIILSEKQEKTLRLTKSATSFTLYDNSLRCISSEGFHVA